MSEPDAPVSAWPSPVVTVKQPSLEEYNEACALRDRYRQRCEDAEAAIEALRVKLRVVMMMLEGTVGRRGE